jgi:uncharacterized protein
MKAKTILAAALACGISPSAIAQSQIDAPLAAFIANIKAVDNHTHVNSTAANDADSDALPIDGLPSFPFPMRLRPENPEWLGAYKALYGYLHNDLSEPHLAELRATMQRVAQEQGDRFPEWVLDKIGTEVMVANRIAMGPGLQPPRFRWASYVDALMLPLSAKAERATSPDYDVLYPHEEKLLLRYLADLKITKLPATLDAYLSTVVTPTLERQQRAGCIAVKFESAYLRKLDFDEAEEATAKSVYARYVSGGEPSHAEYKALQDFLFRRIAHDAGRLGMAVHIHAFEGAGGFYKVAGSDPLLLEPAFNDPSLRQTNFVIVHGGGAFAQHAAAMLWKPNVYVDFSVMPLIYAPGRLAGILRDWLEQFPEKVLFGTDAFGTGPDAGWELAAWLSSTTARQALATALTGMLRDKEVTRPRAEEIATMVLRTNAGKLYGLGLR